MSENPTGTMYETVGGSAFFERLVDRFYTGVASDDRLRPMYPEADLAGAKARLCGFLIQYWGGPDDYSRERGHPRLRMRHAPYPIGIAERDAWLEHMRCALDDALAEGSIAAQHHAEMTTYFDNAATHLINHIPAPERPSERRGLL